MAGPYPPTHGTGPDYGSVRPPHIGSRPVNPPTGYAPAPTAYPSLPPPPAPYPRRPPRRSRRWLTAVLVTAVVALAGLTAAIGYTVRGGGAAALTATGRISETSAERAIQDYLNALADRDIDTIARNTLCGIYDGVTDHRSDNAIAKMNSDAFRKQFSRADVASIDKIVHLSEFQAQALFTMRVARVSRTHRNDHTQGVAQLLAVGDRVLVCSYELRTAGSF